MMFSRVGAVNRSYRHFNRYRRIVEVLVKYRLGDLFDNIDAGGGLVLGARTLLLRRRSNTKKLPLPVRLRLAFEELGPTFTKMGQVLSTRPDIIRPEFIAEFTKLQDSISPFTFALVQQIISTELKSPFETLFQRFEPEPLAAASIGQVHRAMLKTGEEVVVKVQRPDIGSIVEIDIEILMALAQRFEKRLQGWWIYKPQKMVKEFAETLRKEMNYEMEALNMERFARQFSSDERIIIPKVYREYSTQKVLTMEYVEGIKVTEVSKIETAGLDRKIIAARGADLLLEQVFRHGLFHADPHPGNVFVLPGNVICYFDFGMMGAVDRETRGRFSDVLYGYIERDELRTADALLKIVEWDVEPDRRSLQRDLSYFMESYLYRPLKEIRLKDLVQNLLELLSRHRLYLPADIFLMLKTASEVESLGMMLDPDFDITERAAPFVRHMRLERLDPRRLAAHMIDAGEGFVKALSTMPLDMQELLGQAKKGEAKITVQHGGLDQLMLEMNRSANRNGMAIIISALIIASALMASSGAGSHVLNALAAVSLALAGIFGVIFLIGIYRSGRSKSHD